MAAELDLDEAATGRLLRVLTASGVTTAAGDGRYRLGPAGAALVSDTPGSLRSLFRMFGGKIGQSAFHGGEAVRTGAPAFDAHFGMEAFAYLQAHPAEGSVFNASMVDMGAAVGTPPIHAYDWSGVRRLVDVGGGRGQLALAVLSMYPNLEAVIFDAPHVVTEAQAEIDRAGLAGRCRAVGGDFFGAVPEGDCIAMRWIIHDWDDARALQILTSCRRALSAEGRLLLFEVVVPEGDGPHLAKTLDWVMLSCLTGMERTEAEYADLLARAGFRLTRVVPSASPMSVVEAVPV